MDAPPLPPPPSETPPTPAWGPPAPVTPAFKYAGFWQRFAALFIDGLLFVPFFIPFFIRVWNEASRQINVGTGTGSFDFNTMRLGRVRPLLQIGLNALNSVGGVGLLGLLDYLWMLWDRQKQTLHDKIAGTIVVQV